MPRRRKLDQTSARPETKNRRRRARAEQLATQTEQSPPQEETGQPSARDPALAGAERELLKHYPHINLIPGSLSPGAREGWGTKRILDIACVDCQARRTIATSDAFLSDSRCVPCNKAAKKVSKKKEHGP